MQYSTVQYSGLLNNLVDQVHEAYSYLQYSTVQYSGLLNNLVDQVHEGYSTVLQNSIEYSLVSWNPTGVIPIFVLERYDR